VIVLVLLVASGCTTLELAPPSIVAFDSASAQITAGESVTLLWNVTGATSVSLDQGIGTVPVAGTRVVSPASSTVYTLVASNNAGSVSKAVAITVNRPVMVATFDLNPTSITTGGSATLQWNVTGATSVTIDQGIGEVPAAGTRMVSPNTTTTYNLAASSPTGTINKSVVLTVNSPPIIADFSVRPDMIIQGAMATLQWKITGADSIRIEPGVGEVATIGSRAIAPQASTTYTLTARSACCTVSKTVAVEVGNRYYPETNYYTYYPDSDYYQYYRYYGVPNYYPITKTYSPYGPPVVNLFVVSPGVMNYGESATLSWNVTGARSVSINQGIGEVAATGSVIVSPMAETTTFTLTATNDAGMVERSVSLVATMLRLY